MGGFTAMKQLIGIGLVCLVAGGLIGMERSSHSDSEAVMLLQKARQAPLHQDYTAVATTFASYGNRILNTDAVVYNARGGRSRIEYRLGSMAGVIAGRSAPDMHWHYDPLNRSFVTDVEQSARPSDADDPNADPDLQRLLENCRARVVRHTRIAGRPATEVCIEPKTAGGKRRLWVDNETGVILRIEERNAEDSLTAATVYRSITYGKTAPPDRFLPIPPGGEPVSWLPDAAFADRAPSPQEVRTAIGGELKKPRYLPGGYAEEGVYLYRCPGCDRMAAVTRYVDGLNSVTVIQAPRSCEHHMADHPLDFGFGTAVFARKGDHSFSVMGELPTAELKRISDSIGP
jgi:outer membrane lipoprotein-sorting protein